MLCAYGTYRIVFWIITVNRGTVEKMSIYEFDQKEYERAIREEGKEEGKEAQKKRTKKSLPRKT